MPFQFNCPQGHLLSAEPNQAGQQVQCPICQSQFAIPTAPAAAAPPPAVAAAPPLPPPAASAPPATGFGEAEGGFDPLGGVGGFDDVLPAGGEDLGYGGGGGGFGDIDIYSIPCPNGHVLETPAEMIGQQAMCPHCQKQFELREKDSLEYKERRRIEIEKEDAIVGEKWLKRAIWIAVIVGGGLLILVIISIAGGGAE